MSRQNLEVVRRLYAALGQRDLDTMNELSHEHVRYNVRGQRTVRATDGGSLDALRFVQELDQQRVWAVEDCRHVSGRLEGVLIAVGERVIRIPPALMDEQAMDVRLLCDYRDQLISERGRLANRLRWHLLAIDPELEEQLRPAAFEGSRIRARLARQLARLGPSTQVRIAKAMLKRISQLTREERELEAELAALIQEHSAQLLQEHGCGTITAAILIGHTAGAKRFANDAAFALHAGTAPIPASSGNTNRYRLHRGGDRQLNRALHVIALSRARTDPTTRAYLNRKASEGKTKREAIRCLKRHLARHFWKLLYTTNQAAPTARESIHTKFGTTELQLT